MPRARPLLLLLAALLAAQRGAALTLKLYKNKECTGPSMTKALATGYCYAGFAVMQCSSTYSGGPWATIEWFNDTTYCKGLPRGTATVYGTTCVPFWPLISESPVLGNVQLWAVISEPTCDSDPLARDTLNQIPSVPLVLQVFNNTNCSASSGAVFVDFPSTAALATSNAESHCHDGRSLATVGWTAECPQQRYKTFTGVEDCATEPFQYTNCETTLCNSSVQSVAATWRGFTLSASGSANGGTIVTVYADSACAQKLYGIQFYRSGTGTGTGTCFVPGGPNTFFAGSSPIQGPTFFSGTSPNQAGPLAVSFMFVAPKPFSVGAQASLGAGKLPGLQVQGFWDTSCLQQAFEYPAVYPGECSAGSAVIDWGGNWSDPFGHDQGKCQT